MTKQFETPITLKTDGGERMLSTLDEAIDALSDASWPQRGPQHRDALDICLKVKDGHRSLSEARDAIRLAAQEAGLSVSG